MPLVSRHRLLCSNLKKVQAKCLTSSASQEMFTNRTGVSDLCFFPYALTLLILRGILSDEICYLNNILFTIDESIHYLRLFGICLQCDVPVSTLLLLLEQILVT